MVGDSFSARRISGFTLINQGIKTYLRGTRPTWSKLVVGLQSTRGGDFPRLPILGLRAIAENELILKIDGKKREATLRTPINWWPFS